MTLWNLEIIKGNDVSWSISMPVEITNYTLYFTVKRMKDDLVAEYSQVVTNNIISISKTITSGMTDTYLYSIILVDSSQKEQTILAGQINVIDDLIERTV